jgi:hypothetical protein
VVPCIIHIVDPNSFDEVLETTSADHRDLGIRTLCQRIQYRARRRQQLSFIRMGHEGSERAIEIESDEHMTIAIAVGSPF